MRSRDWIPHPASNVAWEWESSELTRARTRRQPTHSGWWARKQRGKREAAAPAAAAASAWRILAPQQRDQIRTERAAPGAVHALPPSERSRMQARQHSEK